MTDCIFCRIAQAEMKARIIYSDEDVVAFYDASPQAPTHILVIPRKHITSLNHCGTQDIAILAKVIETCKKMAEHASINDCGYRIVLNTGPDAGQAVDHVHFHVLGGRKMTWPPG